MSLFEPENNFGQLRDDVAEFEYQVDEDAPRLERSGDRSALRPYVGAVLLVALGLFGRLFFLQVAEGSSHQLLAEGNRIRNQEVQPPRGVITDRHGEVLAKNVPAFGLELVPANLPRTRDEREPVYQKTAELTGKSADEIREAVSAEGLSSLEPMLLLDQLSHDDAILLKVKVGDTPGLRVVDRPLREYADAPGLSHLLGYTGKISAEELEASNRYTLSSVVGKAGLERQYEELLHGTRGVEQVEVDSRGYLQRVVGREAPVSGDTVVLSLDLALQRKVGEALAKRLEEVGSKAGSAIVIDPRDGSIRAMISLPDYPSNEFARGISTERFQELLNDPRNVLTNRSVVGQYPSGSVIKPFVAAGGLAEGVISETTTINAPGEIRIGEFVFPDWKVHGVVDVKKAIAVSSNVFFYAVGGGWESIKGLGIERMNHYLELFGFGKRTGIDLPSEQEGLIPTPEWKQEVKGEPWYLGDTYHAAIGQGDLLVTPLQIANATATVANGGTIQTPHFLWKDQPVEGEGGIAPPGEQATDILDGNVLRIVREGMRQGVTEGSSRRLQSVPIPMAGKTGTAQFGTEDKTHAWWTGFGPYEGPELAMTVLIEGGGAGNEVAVPVAEEVFKWYYEQPPEARK